MTTAQKSKRLKELTSVRITYEKEAKKIWEDIGKLELKIAKKNIQLTVCNQKQSSINGKLATLAEEIRLEIAEKNKEW